MAGGLGVSPHETKRVGALPIPATPPRVGPKPLANPQPTGAGKGGPGGRTPHGGGAVGGALFTPTKVSLFEKGRPSPTLIKAGVEGAKPHGGGSGGCPPTKPKEGARCPPLQPRHEWGPSHWRTLSLRGWAKGVQGGVSPRGGGLWGVSPRKDKRGNELPTLATPPRVGPKTPANPKPTGVGTKGGPGGRSPHGGGLWGVSPHKFKRGGEAPTLTNPLRVGPKTLANLQPTGVGTKGGPGGASPMAGGLGDVPPQFQKGGK
jgi:hypothetical protein